MSYSGTCESFVLEKAVAQKEELTRNKKNYYLNITRGILLSIDKTNSVLFTSLDRGAVHIT